MTPWDGSLVQDTYTYLDGTGLAKVLYYREWEYECFRRVVQIRYNTFIQIMFDPRKMYSLLLQGLTHPSRGLSWIASICSNPSKSVQGLARRSQAQA